MFYKREWHMSTPESATMTLLKNAITAHEMESTTRSIASEKLLSDRNGPGDFLGWLDLPK